MFESIKIHTNSEINYDDLLTRLVDYGYHRVNRVHEAGDYSVRGGLLDIFPITFEFPVRIDLSNHKVESIKSFDLYSQETFESHNIVIILPFTALRKRKLKKEIFFSDSAPINNFIDIEVGDYVVHTDHGVGIYRGIQRLKSDKKFKEHIVIEYLGNDKLFVPFEDMDLVQKYIGFESAKPKIYKLGSGLWEKVKKKAKQATYSLAFELVEMQANRSIITGHSFAKDTDWQKKLEEEFPYKETPDQLRSSIEVKADMESKKPMDRLLCGDVGYGKTEVALRSAFKAVMDNKQVAILVPTTILAEQHFNTFSQRMRNFPVVIDMLSRFKSPGEQKDILKKLEKGEVDIIIGTHRLLSKDVAFKDLGLLIIDEEQRFGVEHKEKLKKMRLLVDVLTLTATPIPRTLYMSMMGVRDISVINTPPIDRLPIETNVATFSDQLVTHAIKNEITRSGQVFFVNNRINGIEKIASNIIRLVPEARVALAHGRMNEKTLESTMQKFFNREIDVLVSTTIVESGIDNPNANTLIINNADMFGLADLYQLRGRVGRFNKQAYAYLLVRRHDILTSEAQKRLDTLSKFTELGAGFKIAMKDLEMRGAGNMLGKEQHGHIEAVGFDLYCRLLKSSVESIKKALPRNS